MPLHQNHLHDKTEPLCRTVRTTSPGGTAKRQIQEF